MIRYIKYGMILFLFIFMVSCFPPGENIVGTFLEVTVTGTYFNELTGNMTTDTEELKAVINLYPLDTGNKIQEGGHFQPGGGIIYSSTSGFNVSDSTVSGTGTAHVNGFIAKGPFAEGSEISIAIINEDMSRLEIEPEFIEQLQGETDGLSQFSIELPATEDADININLNSLTFLQTARMYELIENDNMSFYDAYLQSKEEILSLVNLESGVADIEDFEKMDIREDGDSNAVLFLANSILAADESAQTKQSDTILQMVLEQISNNGAILDEGLGDLLAERFINLDFAGIKQLLINYFENQGQTVNIPDSTEFQDDDGDGIINRYDISLLEPIGLIDESTGTIPTGFSWTPINLPPDSNKEVKYILQISKNPYFDPRQTAEFIVDTTQYNNISPNYFNQNVVYYWRVTGQIDGIKKRWSASSSFILQWGSSPPYGDVNILNGQFIPTRQIIIDNTQIVGASKMSISIDSVPVIVDESFELFRRIILPEGTGTYQITATYENPAGDIYNAYPITVDVDPNQPVEANSFLINGGATETITDKVFLDFRPNPDAPGTGVKYAYKMRLSNDQNTLNNQQWKPFSSRLSWTLDDDPNNSPKKVYAQFANSHGVSNVIDAEITIVSTHTLFLTVEQNLVVEVFHDLDGSSIINPDPIDTDYSNLYFPSQDTDGDGIVDPYEIPIRQGSLVYFDVSSGGDYYHNGYTEDPNNPSFIPTGLDFDYIQVGNGDYIITVLSILG